MRLQDQLLAVARASRPVTDHVAWNTAVSFVTNTNWQAYSGESTMGHLVQMAGLAVQNFVSAAVGIAVAVALVRGFARAPDRPAGQLLGRPDPDHAADPAADLRWSRAIVLIAGGAVQNLSGGTDVTTLAGGDPAHHRRSGGQPGGHQGARHQRRRLLQRQQRAPVREPDDLDELARDLPAAGDLVQPAAGVRPDGRRQPAGLRDRRGDGDPRHRQRRHSSTCFELRTAARCRRRSARRRRARRPGSASPNSATFAAATTLTSTGCGGLVPRLVHRARRHDADRQHDARRGRARRHRFGPVRHARSSR